MTNIKQIFATGFIILTKSNLYQQHAGNKKFTKLQFFFLHLFPFTEHILIKLWQNSMKLKISLFSSIFPFIVVNKNRFSKSEEFFYSIILFDFPRCSYYTHFHEYGQQNKCVVLRIGCWPYSWKTWVYIISGNNV